MNTKILPKRAIHVLLFLMLIFLAGLTLYPFIWMILCGFKNNAEIFVSSWDLPKVWRFANFVKVWKTGVGQYFFNSLFVTVVSTIGATVFSTLAAYPLARVQTKLSRSVLIFIMAGLMLAPQVALIPLYKLLQTLHFYNTYLAMIVPNLAFRIPFTTFLLWSHFLTIPKELEEAAFVDGATINQILAKVILPISKPILATSILLSVRVVWNEFMFALVFIESSKLKTITVGLKGMISNTETNWGVVIAGLTLSILPVIALFLLTQKQFVRGLAAGSVKG